MKKKILSLLTAFAMVFGIIAAPFTSASAAEATETESVTIHKILLTKDALEKHDVNKDYDGTTIEDIKDFFGDQSAEEIKGVYFKLQKPANDVTNPDVNKDEDWVDVEGKAGKTTADGLRLDTKGLKGTFRIVEDLTKSTYDGVSYFDKNGNQLYKKGEEFFRPKKGVETEDVKVNADDVITKENNLLADSKAVPTLLTLPMVNEDGIIKEGHVYPKNTQDIPKVDKDFKDQNTLRPANLEADEEEKAEIKGGADVENNQRDKKVATADLGENVPYEIKTVIPAHTKYKTLAWDDTMSKGLTFNDDVTLKIGEAEATLGEDYIVSYKDNGFVIQLLEAGLDKVYNKDTDTKIYITYSATVNEEAEPDKREKNKLNFLYDNNVSVKGKPEPTNPVNGELKVTKDFPGVTGDWVKGEEVTVTIIDEATGKPVDFSKLEGEEVKKQSATVVLTENKKTHTWKGLDNNKQYKVVETFKPSDIVTYEKGANGQVTIHDEIKPEDERPKKITPSVPEVVLGGKRFVKTNNEKPDSDKLERLEGAEFYVKNAKGEYLVPKAKNEEAGKVVTKAKEELDKAVKAYNDLSAEAQKGEEGTKALKLVEEKQNAYDTAVKENAIGYDWGDQANAIVLTSDKDGKFEIKGLAYADKYQLEEKTAPKDYAKLSGPVEFNVKEGSYDNVETDIAYEKEGTANNAKQVPNKKVTIPQTGGIGSVIFIVAGLAIMGGAFVAYKRSQATA